MEYHLAFTQSKDNSEVAYTVDDHEGTFKIEYVDISMKTKSILKCFGGNFGTLRYNENYFFK